MGCDRRARAEHSPRSAPLDRAPHLSHQGLHVAQVVEGEQAGAGQVLVASEVVQIGAGVARAGLAVAALDDRRVVARRRAPWSGRCGSGPPGSGASAVPCLASRVGIAQSNRSMPSAIPTSRSSISPMPSRWRGASSGSSGSREAEHAVHLLLLAPQRAADRDPVDPGRRRPLGRFAAQVLVDPALDDPEDRLVGRALPRVPLEAAVEPAVGALGRARRVVAVGVGRGALVEGEGDVRAERRLDPHRLLGAEEAVGAVEQRLERHPLFGDLDLRAARRRCRAAP